MEKCIRCGDETPLMVKEGQTCWFCHEKEQTGTEGISSALKDAGYHAYLLDDEGNCFLLKETHRIVPR
jgi:hypothetical protein